MNRCTKALLYKDNLTYNLKQIRNFVNSDVKLCVAVKANGYGHNAVLSAKLAQENGIDFLAVATVDEGIELRNAGITCNILLLSLSTPQEFYNLFKYKITPVVFMKDYIQLLIDSAKTYYSNNKIATKFKVHLAVDTGMGRIGCFPQEVTEQACLIHNSEYLELGGMITHFAVSDSVDADNVAFTDEQALIFKNAVEDVKALGINPGICSCGSSAALLNTNYHFDMFRPGIIVYGYYPDQITKEYLKSKNVDFDIKPVLALQTQVVAIRHYPKGKTISYGRTYTCPTDTDIAVLPIGYADGLLRRFSPGLTVTINGKQYPVRGRICMDQCMVDLGNNHDVKLFDKVIIFGPDNSGAKNTADDLAKIGNTISYEVLTSLTNRVEREIV